MSVAVTGVLAVAACGGGRAEDDDVPRATVGTMATSTTTTTSAASAAETTTSTTEPLSREDFLRRKVVELFAIRDELLQHPDPSRITEWLSPNCECFAVEKGILDEFATNSYHLTGPASELLAVEFTQEDPGFVGMTVIWRGADLDVVDANGGFVRDRPSFPTVGVLVALAQDSSGTWLVHALINLTLLPEILDEVLQKGLP